jgi:ribulose kinase
MLSTEGPELVGELQVVPDFHGNRSPLANPTATGAVAGLTLDHSFDSLARLYYATALGIALGTRHIIEALDRSGYAIRTIHLTGGHITNPLLVGLYADAAGREVSIPQEEDSVLLGTAAVAAAASGVHPSVNAAARAMIRQGRGIRPVPGTAKFFDRQYRRFLLMLDQQDALRKV